MHLMTDGVLALTVVSLVELAYFPLYTCDSRTDTARTDIVGLLQSVEMYQLQKHGACPGTVEDLRGAGVIRKANSDPWGNEYVIFCQPGLVAVLSAGQDGRFGNDDDISSHDVD